MRPNPFAFLSRRRFLAVSLAGLSLAVGGGTGGLLALRGTVPHVEGLRCLSDRQFRTLCALAQVMLPAGPVFPLGALELDLPRAMDRFLADEPGYIAKDLRTALTLLEFGPLLFDFRFTTFGNLPEPARLAHFESWCHSGRLLRRQVALAFRKFFCLVYYDHEAIWSHIGYPGPRLPRQDP